MGNADKPDLDRPQLELFARYQIFAVELANARGWSFADTGGTTEDRLTLTRSVTTAEWSEFTAALDAVLSKAVGFNFFLGYLPPLPLLPHSLARAQAHAPTHARVRAGTLSHRLQQQQGRWPRKFSPRCQTRPAA